MLQHKAEKGFTLLEVVIALAIITIISGGIFLVVRQSPRRALHNASLQLQADMRYAQRRAIMEGRRFGIEFNTARNRYRIMATNPTEEIRVVYFEGRINLWYTTRTRLDFLPRGTASSGFRIRISNGRYEQQLTATVSGGRIEIFEITIQ